MAVPAKLRAAKTATAETLLGRHQRPATASGWAEAARDGAQSRLLAMGGPAARDEYWRYTNPQLLTSETAEAKAFAVEEVAVFDEVDALRLVFVDGGFRADLSDDPAMDGVEITSLADVLATDIHWAKDIFGVLEAAGQDPVERPLAALNTAMAEAGFVIRVTGKPARPINLRYLHQNPTSDAIIRHLIRVEAGAEVTILENGPAAARFNKAMEVDIADDGICHHVRAQGRDHDRLAATAMFARLGARSAFKSFTLTVNGRLTRNETVIEFTGDDAVGHIAGAAIGEGDFSHDDTVFVTHDAVGCESRQVFKKVLKDGAKGVFQGKILVRKDAQKTDGYQISQGLLLSDNAEFLAKPELEIYADDVACSHGSTCGAVDETVLFYLRSRGVPEAEAKDMMVIAFVDDAVQEIDDEAVADVIRNRIEAWLARRSAA
ncbi:MAG: SufD family Fe-S cluster assembly protein [Pseudomonadota bacterium]